MNDNLARVLEDEAAEYQRRKAEEKKRRNHAKMMMRRRRFVCGLVAAIMGFSLIFCQAKVHEVDLKYNEVSDNYKNLKADNDQKQATLDSSMTIEEIESIARNKLGMNKPANNQIIYVSIKKEDVSFVAED